MTWSRGASHVIVTPMGLSRSLAVISGNTVSIKGTRYSVLFNAFILVDRETYCLSAEFFLAREILIGTILVGPKLLGAQLSTVLF